MANETRTTAAWLVEHGYRPAGRADYERAGVTGERLETAGTKLRWWVGPSGELTSRRQARNEWYKSLGWASTAEVDRMKTEKGWRMYSTQARQTDPGKGRSMQRADSPELQQYRKVRAAERAGGQAARRAKQRGGPLEKLLKSVGYLTDKQYLDKGQTEGGRRRRRH